MDYLLNKKEEKIINFLNFYVLNLIINGLPSKRNGKITIFQALKF